MAMVAPARLRVHSMQTRSREGSAKRYVGRYVEQTAQAEVGVWSRGLWAAKALHLKEMGRQPSELQRCRAESREKRDNSTPKSRLGSLLPSLRQRRTH
jgi:hypothetical protein